jgi:XTP/dITP diphosphohydrolase
MQLLIATTNQGKITEISDLLQELDLDLLTPQAIHLDLTVEETGATYLENARLKALAYSRATGLPTLADDTGLEVAALAGQPGLHSARFIPDPLPTDRDRVRCCSETGSLSPSLAGSFYLCGCPGIARSGYHF